MRSYYQPSPVPAALASSGSTFAPARAAGPAQRSGGARSSSPLHSAADRPIAPARAPWPAATDSAFDRLPILPGSPPALQAQLEVGPAGDSFELEAERVAERVVADAARPRRRSCSCGGSCPACRKRKQRDDAERPTIRRLGRGGKSLAAAPPSVRDALAAPGRSLAPSTRRVMEEKFGHDFSRVRVHTGRGADRSAAEIGARAYTVGRDIVFRNGEYAPGTPRGDRLLAHELTHVVQQRGAPASTPTAAAAASPRARSRDEVVQRDLAIAPPRPEAEPRVLTEAQIASAIAFNERVIGGLADSAAIIELVRDVIGVSPQPAVIDAEFVEGVVSWQASFGLAQDGRLGPATARPLFREIGAEGVGRGEIRRRPRYNVAGPINVPRAGARQAPFTFTAEFRSDPANGIFPSCCEIRQDIQWDAAFVASAVASGTPTVPHAGFPAAHPAGTWIEDRDQANGRYGHRTGPSSDPGPGDRYLDPRGQQNQAFGHRYEGRDTPRGLAGDRGSWSFRLRVIDVCNGNRLLAVSPTLVVNWL